MEDGGGMVGRAGGGRTGHGVRTHGVRTRGDGPSMALRLCVIWARLPRLSRHLLDSRVNEEGGGEGGGGREEGGG